MRLTLRTLLAYLDDRLEPADAKAIGAKIAESPVAPAMIDRIREVLRRRRVAAPQISGPGSGPDPNLVAEYLDLTLPPEHVAEIERICLESDIHLAEVAATHQVLTLVLGEAVDIPPTMRERMYALGVEAAAPAEGNGHGRERLQTTAASERAAVVASLPVSVQGAGPFEGRLPAELRRRPLWQRLLPIAVPLVLIGWLYLVLPDFFGGITTPDRDAPAVAQAEGPQNNASAAPEVPSAVQQDAAVGDGAAADTPVANSNAVDGQPVESGGPTSDTMPEGAPVAEGLAGAATLPPAEVPTPVPAPVQAPVPEVAVAPATAAPIPEPARKDLPPIMYDSVEGVLLQYEREEDDWTVMPRHALIHPGDRLACPDPFTSQMSVAEGLCELTLNSGTSLEWRVPVGEMLFSLDLVRGRLGLYRPDGDQPVKFGVRVGRQEYGVELLERDTLCGIEVIPRPCQGQPQGPPTPVYDGGIFVASGAVLLTRQDGQQLMLRNDSGWLPWQGSGAPPEPGPLLAVPQWLVPGGPSLAAIYRPYANQYEREFVLDEPVSYSIPAIVKDRRPRMSEFAVQTLALTDNYRQLLRALQADHSEARHAAIIGLRQWLPQSPENGPLLKDEIGRVFRDTDVDTVYGLLWGATEDDARDPEASEKLVLWLGHEDIAIRELACKNLLDVTGRDNDYQPMAPLVQRQAAIGRWIEHLKRYGALLPPSEAAPAP
jgi:hypothetical protein